MDFLRRELPNELPNGEEERLGVGLFLICFKKTDMYIGVFNILN